MMRNRLVVCLAALSFAIAGCGGGSGSSSGTVDPPVIDTQPMAVTVDDGDEATFEIVASGADLTYQWQRSDNDGADWDDVPGADAAELAFNAEYDADDGAIFRCVVANPGGDVTSDEVALTVVPAAPAVTVDPVNATVAEGDSAAFSVTATGKGMSYQWYRSDDGTEWNELPGADAPGYTTSATYAPDDDGSAYRCRVWNTGGDVVSTVATLTVIPGAPVFNPGPADATVDHGATATFTVTVVSSMAVTYEWQVSTDGGLNWTAVPGADEDSHEVQSVDWRVHDGHMLRCVAVNTGGTTNSNPATLGVTPPPAPVINTQPQNASVNDGAQASFSVSATSGYTIAYSWQRWSTVAEQWQDVPSATADTIEFAADFDADDGALFRCIVTAEGVDAISLPALLTVIPAAPGINDPVDVTVADGGEAVFGVAATGKGDITYQWQRQDGLGNWVDIGGETTTTYTIVSVDYDTDNGAVFRCAASNSGGTTTSDYATLTVTVEAPLVVGPGDVTASDGDEAVFSVLATGKGGLTYQWSRSDDGSSWSPIHGATSSAYTLVSADYDADDGALFKCAVTNPGGTTESVEAELTVVPAQPQLTTHPESCSAPEGDMAVFAVEATGKGISYLWQLSDAQYGTYVDIADGGAFSGSGSNELFINPAAYSDHDNRWFRCVVSNSGGQVTSAPAMLTVSTVWRVDADKTGGDGRSWATAFGELQSAIDAAREYDEVWVKAGVHTPTAAREPADDRTKTFILKANVRIYGGFDGAETARGQRDIVSNVTVLSGEIGDPGAADNCYNVVIGVDGMYLDGFTITGGNADDPEYVHSSGGGMFTMFGGEVRNCIFIANSAGSGGGMRVNGNGLQVVDCSFIGNTANVGGGVSAGYSTARFTRCTFEANEAVGAFQPFGGGMFLHGFEGTISQSVFQDNSAERGGAVYVEDGAPDFIGTQFIDNSAKVGGGMFNYRGDVLLSGCRFEGNAISGSDPNIGGGALYNHGVGPDMQIVDCDFVANTANAAGDIYRYGGAIRNYESSPAIEGCLFDSNEAWYGGGAISNHEFSNPSITGCTFIDNSAYGYTPNGGVSFSSSGGAIYYLQSGGSLTDCAFASNTSLAGGALYAVTCSTAITDCRFEQNQASAGGAAYILNCPALTIDDCDFIGNTAAGSGGAIRNQGSATSLRGCRFENNAVTMGYGTGSGAGGGGAVFNAGGAGSAFPRFVDCWFVANAADSELGSVSHGGAMSNIGGSHGQIVNCVFFNNKLLSPDGVGGAVYNDASSPSIINCTVVGNSVAETGQGGGIANDTGSSPTIANTIFWANHREKNPDQIVNIDAGSSPAVSHCCIEGGYASGMSIITGDPLVDIVVGTLAIGTGSSCIDVGDDSSVPFDIDTDIAGNDRFVDGTTGSSAGIVDIGAHEYQGL